MAGRRMKRRRPAGGEGGWDADKEKEGERGGGGGLLGYNYDKHKNLPYFHYSTYFSSVFSKSFH